MLNDIRNAGYKPITSLWNR